MTDAAFTAWFETLYTRYANDIIRVSYFYLADRGKAEDVCHDAFMALYTKRPELEEGKEKAWLMKVAVNRCKDIWRSAWIRRVISGSPVLEMVPDQQSIDKHLEGQEVLAAVHALPPEVREVFILYYYQGFSQAEIADITGTTQGTVSSRLFRGKQKLKRYFEEGEEQP